MNICSSADKWLTFLSKAVDTNLDLPRKCATLFSLYFEISKISIRSTRHACQSITAHSSLPSVTSTCPLNLAVSETLTYTIVIL